VALSHARILRKEESALVLEASGGPDGVELGHADELSYETVRRTLKKTSSQAPPQASVGDPSEGKSAAPRLCGGWRRSY
jgi:hypothetical protein